MTLEVNFNLFENDNGQKGAEIEPDRLFPGETFIVEILAGDFRDIEQAGITELSVDFDFSNTFFELISPLDQQDNFDLESSIIAPGLEVINNGTLTGNGISNLILGVGGEQAPIGVNELTPIAQLTLETREFSRRDVPLAVDFGENGFVLADGATEEQDVEVKNRTRPIDILPQLEVVPLLFESNNGEKGDRITDGILNPGETFFIEFFVQDVREKVSLEQLGVKGLGLDLDFDDEDFDEEQFELISPLDAEGTFLAEQAITAEGFNFFTGGNFNPEEGTIEGLSASAINLNGEDNAPIGEIGRFESFAELEFQAKIGGEVSQQIPFDASLNPTQSFSLQEGTALETAAVVRDPFLRIANEVDVEVRLFESIDGDKGNEIFEVFNRDLVNPGQEFFLEFFVRDNRENIPEEDLGISGLGLDIDFDPEKLTLVSPLDEEGALQPEVALTPESFTNFVGGTFDEEEGLIEGLSGSSIILGDENNGEPIGRGEFESFALLEFAANQTETSVTDQLEINLNPTLGLSLEDGTSDSEIDVGIEQQAVAIAPPVEFDLLLFEDNNGEKGELISSAINPGQTFFIDVLVRDNRVNLPENSTGFTALGIDFTFDSEGLELISPLNNQGELIASEAIVPEDFTSFVGGTLDAENGLIEGLSASSLVPDGEDGSAIGAGEFEPFASLRFQRSLTDTTTSEAFRVTTNPTQGFALQDGTTEQDVILLDETQSLAVNEFDFIEGVEIEAALFENNDGELGNRIETISLTEDIQEITFAEEAITLLRPGESFFLEIRVKDNRENLPFQDLGFSGLGIDLEFESDVFELLSPVDETGALLPEEAIVSDSFTSFIQGSFDAENGRIEGLSGSSIQLGEESSGEPIGVGEFETFARLQFQAENFFADELAFDLDINPVQGFTLQDGQTNNDISIQETAPEVKLSLDVFEQETFRFESVNINSLSAGDIIGQVSLLERDRQDAIVLEIIEENDNNPLSSFNINSQTGEISIANLEALVEDAEITILASDPGGALDTTKATIEIEGAGPPPNSPPRFSSDPFLFSIVDVDGQDNNDVGNGDAVGRVQANDPNEDPLRFEIIDGNDPDNNGANAFAINPENGEISVANAEELLEDRFNGQLIVQATDDGRASDQATVNIPINGPGNEPPVVNNARFQVSEFALEGDVVGTIQVSDPDGDEVTFSLNERSQAILLNSLTGNNRTEDIDVDRDGNNPFALDNNGVITVNDPDDLSPEPEALINIGSLQLNVATRPISSFELIISANDGENEGQGRATIDVEFEPVGAGFGDPHVISFDSKPFDFQVVGEFTLVTSDEDSDRLPDENGDLNIQVRTQPTIIQADGSESANLSDYTAIATEIDGQTVGIYARGESPNPVFIDGEPIALGDLQSIAVGDDGQVTNLGSGFFSIDLGTDRGNERIIVQVFEDRIDPRVSLADSRNGNITGLLGNKDGDPSNEIINAQGNVIENASFEQINNDFAQALRITEDANSLLLLEGETLSDINDLEFSPIELTDTQSLEQTRTNLLNAGLGITEAQLDAVVAQVQEAEISQGFLFNAAVVDLAVAGDQSYLSSARSAEAGNTAPQVETTVFRIPEDLPDRAFVGTVNIEDADSNLADLAVTIAEGNTDINGNGDLPFRISPQGQINVDDGQDLAAQPGSIFNLTVQVEDPLGAISTNSTIIVEDDPNLNQAPIVVANTVNSLAESRPVGTEVGTVNAVDPDGDELSLTLEGELDIDGDGTDAFAISPDGAITVADPDDIDFEADLFADQEQPSLTFNVIGTEDTTDALTGQTTVTVGLLDRAEEGNIDIDDDGIVSETTDAILLFRSLSEEFPNNDLTIGALGENAQRTDPQAINEFVQGLADNLAVDIDNDGIVSETTDAILLFRSLSEFPNSVLTIGALGENAQRTDPQAINEFVQNLVDNSIAQSLTIT